MIKQTSFCPCGNHRPYEKCCGNYISGRQFPETAEALMRSRYTAYTQGNIIYIQTTMRDKASENFNPIEAEKLAKTVKWKRLKIKRTFSNKTHTCNYVEFTAYYILNGMPQKLSEISEFRKIEEKWYYVDRL